MRRIIATTGAGVVVGGMAAAGAIALAPAERAQPVPVASRPAPPALPDVAIAQVAYDRAKAAAAGRHVEGLRIDKTDCGSIAQGRFLCQIRYAVDDEPSGRLHFTVVTLERDDRGWTLTNGLCRGDGPGAP